MRDFSYKDLKIFVCDDANEWVSNFYELPDDGNEYELDLSKLPESAGFAQIDDKEIYLFKRNDCSFLEMLSTVAHEYGHIVEGGFTNNPPDDDEYFELHEQKAEFYENFVKDCYQITAIALSLN